MIIKNLFKNFKLLINFNFSIETSQSEQLKEQKLREQNLSISKIDKLIEYFETKKITAQTDLEKKYIEEYLNILNKLKTEKTEILNQKLYNELLENDPILREIVNYNLSNFLQIPIDRRLKYVTKERKDFSELKDDIISGKQVDLTISFEYGGKHNNHFENNLYLYMLLPDNVGKVYVGNKAYSRNSINGVFIGENGELLKINDGLKISLKPVEPNNNLDSFIGSKNEIIIEQNGKNIKYLKVEGIFRKDGKKDGEILIFKEGMVIKRYDSNFSTLGIRNGSIPGTGELFLDNSFHYVATTIRGNLEIAQNEAFLNYYNENLDGIRKNLIDVAMDYYSKRGINGAKHCTDWVKKIYQRFGLKYYGSHNIFFDRIVRGGKYGTGIIGKDDIPLPESVLDELKPGDSIDVDFFSVAGRKGFNKGNTHTALITRNLGGGKVETISYPNYGIPPKLEVYDLKNPQNPLNPNGGVKLLRARQPV